MSQWSTVSYSEDKGTTWIFLVPYMDIVLDDRDGGILAFDDKSVFNNDKVKVAALRNVDFAQGIGASCKFNDHYINEIGKLVAEAAKNHGKFSVTTDSCDIIEEYATVGYSFVYVEADVTALARVYKSVLEKIKGEN